jgi:hypothetical protein
MANSRIISSSLSFLLISGNVSGLAIGIHGCSNNSVEQQGLPRENAEVLLKDYVGKHAGNLTTLKGIIQGNSPSEANAELEVNNFFYDDGKSHYSGPVIASFTRYTDGQWVMKRFTINPQNLFGAVWFNTDEKVPTAEKMNQINQERLWSEPQPWAGGMALKEFVPLLCFMAIMAIPVLVYIFQPKKKAS